MVQSVLSPSVSPRSVDRGLLLIRLVVGLVFAMHGWMKLSVMGVAGTAAFLGSLGVPLPEVNAVLIITVELVGGLLLALGAVTRIVGTLLAFSMLVAFITVHAANGFFLPDGYEFVMTLALVSAALVVTGAGGYSVDARLFGRAPQSAEAVSYRRAA
jgi:putative oxidoreductase